MNDMLSFLFAVGIVLIIIGFITFRRKKSVQVMVPVPDSYRDILEKDVPFYEKLSAGKKTEFETRLMHFLATTRITGVRTKVEEEDKVYVAASAIIPIFGFPDWEYNNLEEVLLYPDSFNHDFEQTGEGRNILGMVGDGPMQRVMVISQHDLRQAFWNRTGKENTAIHEFVHLIDKTDGATDGVPQFFVDRQYVKPWIQLIHREVRRIRENQSDINPYGATNEAEFFAVVSEYFFERPELLQQKHPELYTLLTHLFQQQPGDTAKNTIP